MSEFVKIAFGPLAAPKGGTYVVFVGADLKPAPRAAALLRRRGRAHRSHGQNGPLSRQVAERDGLVEAAGLEGTRLLVVGVAPGKDGKPIDFATLGGFVCGKLGAAKKVAVAFEAPEGEWDAAAAAEFALGLRLRAYRFDKYKSKKDDGEEADDAAPAVTIETATPRRRAARRARREAPSPRASSSRATLVNEPPNVLFPDRFAERAMALKKLGVEVEVLDEKAMAKLGMGALLAVGQGSERDSRLVVMRWRGAQVEKAKPVVVRRQGRLLRLRRHFDQAGRRHGGHEGRHGGRGLRRRPDARARQTQGQGQRGRRHRPGREHAGRRRLPARRHPEIDVRARRSRSSTPTRKAGSCSPTRYWCDARERQADAS